MGQNDKPSKRWTDYVAYAAMAVLFGPFVLIYAGALLGFGQPSGDLFGTWFMGSLTLCGIGSIWFFSGNSWETARREMGCLVVLAAVTIWWGSIFYKLLTKLMGW